MSLTGSNVPAAYQTPFCRNVGTFALDARAPDDKKETWPAGSGPLGPQTAWPTYSSRCSPNFRKLSAELRTCAPRPTLALADSGHTPRGAAGSPGPEAGLPVAPTPKLPGSLLSCD